MTTPPKTRRADWPPARSPLIGRYAARGPRCAGGRSPGPSPVPVRVPPPPRVTEPAPPRPCPRGCSASLGAGSHPWVSKVAPAASFRHCEGWLVGDAAPQRRRRAGVRRAGSAGARPGRVTQGGPAVSSPWHGRDARREQGALPRAGPGTALSRAGEAAPGLRGGHGGSPLLPHLRGGFSGFVFNLELLLCYPRASRPARVPPFPEDSPVRLTADETPPAPLRLPEWVRRPGRRGEAVM